MKLVATTNGLKEDKKKKLKWEAVEAQGTTHKTRLDRSLHRPPDLEQGRHKYNSWTPKKTSIWPVSIRSLDVDEISLQRDQ